MWETRRARYGFSGRRAKISSEHRGRPREASGNDLPLPSGRVTNREKMLAGTGTDLSGVTTKQTGSFLTWTQEKQVDGLLFLGVAGGGKSMLAKWAASSLVEIFRTRARIGARWAQFPKS